ncbi:MAG: hypothetical protein MUO31_10995 [Thermodesulfovibrionales bacterium]|nr:hypothetical protein [Thermodesulfovibrionales bacterium]
MNEWQRLIIVVLITTVGWVLVTLLTRPTDKKTLLRFYRTVSPGGPGWRKILREASQSEEGMDEFLREKWDVPSGILGAFLGIVAVYSILFSIGFWLYSNTLAATITSIVAAVSSFSLVKIWKKIKFT